MLFQFGWLQLQFSSRISLPSSGPYLSNGDNTNFLFTG